MLRWVELTPSYRCNNRCLGCFSVDDNGPTMDSREIISSLTQAHRDGARSLWLGGGEPTLRRDLFAIVRTARAMGFSRVKLQTNGMLLAYQDFADRCAEAGVTEVAFSIKGAREATHDRLAQTPGCHALMLQAMEGVRARGLAMEGDVLVYRSNASEIPEMVRAYTSLGVERFRLWMLSSTDSAVRDEVPRIDAVMPFVLEAMELGLSPREDFIVSLHTPACTVPVRYHRALFNPRDLSLRVVNPGGHAFMLETSPMEGGHYLADCAGCSVRSRCNGLRQDYLALHGTLEFRPF